MINSYKITDAEPEGSKPLGRRRCRWENNIKIGHRQIEWEGMDWSHVFQDSNWYKALVKMIMNCWVL
jgi:hypothetical protein